MERKVWGPTLPKIVLPAVVSAPEKEGIRVPAIVGAVENYSIPNAVVPTRRKIRKAI